MLNNEDLVKIDNALQACGELRMSSKEERWLEYSKCQVAEPCDVYKIAQKVIVQRDKTRTRKSESLRSIVELAANEGCHLEEKEPEKRDTIPPLFCGGLL